MTLFSYLKNSLERALIYTFKAREYYVPYSILHKKLNPTKTDYFVISRYELRSRLYSLNHATRDYRMEIENSMSATYSHILENFKSYTPKVQQAVRYQMRFYRFLKMYAGLNNYKKSYHDFEKYGQSYFQECSMNDMLNLGKVNELEKNYLVEGFSFEQLYDALAEYGHVSNGTWIGYPPNGKIKDLACLIAALKKLGKIKLGTHNDPLAKLFCAAFSLSEKSGQGVGRLVSAADEEMKGAYIQIVKKSNLKNIALN